MSLPGTALVFSAHPDDAEIGCGGTIAALRAKGVRSVVVNLTVSEKADERRSLRMKCAADAAAILGYELEWAFGGQYDQVADIPGSDLVRYTDAKLSEVRPSVVISHWRHDFHNDHRCVSAALRSAIRRSSSSHYEMMPSEARTHALTGFRPNVFVDISDHLDVKRAAIECYQYPDQSFQPLVSADHEGIARYYGLALGVDAAEAFDCVMQRGFGAFL